MKKMFRSIFISVFCLSATTPVNAQIPELWGMTPSGGLHGQGCIFRINGDGSGDSVIYSFTGTHGSAPWGSLTLSSNGKMYGTTRTGGLNGMGVLFSFDPRNNTYSVVFNFDTINGTFPINDLTEASNGKLYGLTYGGGVYSSGVLFSLDTGNNTFQKLFDFRDTLGRLPSGALIQGNNGRLYGLTTEGGTKGWGVIFSFNPDNNTYSKLFDFNDTTGIYPQGSLMQADDDKLYGMTHEANLSAYGTIFSFDPVGNTYSTIHLFDSLINGWDATGNLIQATNGKLYGMTYQGGFYDDGAIFSIDPASNAYQKLYDLYDSIDFIGGGGPFGSPMQASDGSLYGMVHQGGSTPSGGVAFRFDIEDSIYTPILNFNGSNGGSPLGSLIELKKKATSVILIEEHFFTLSPNPATSKLSLQTNTSSTTLTYQILSSDGLTLMQNKVANQPNFEIDVSTLPTGLYFLALQDNRHRWVKKFVKE